MLVGEAEVAAQDVAGRLVIGVVQERRQSAMKMETKLSLDLMEYWKKYIWCFHHFQFFIKHSILTDSKLKYLSIK